MKQAIESFIKSKKISLNSQKSYTYDLQQFLTVTKGEISQQSLLIYQQFLLDLKPAAQKEKYQLSINFSISFMKVGTWIVSINCRQWQALVVSKSGWNAKIYRLAFSGITIS